MVDNSFTSESADRNNIEQQPAVELIHVAGSQVPSVGLPLGQIELRLSMRKDEWFRSLGEQLEKQRAQDSHFSVKDAFDREDFLTLFLVATQMAMRTHQEVKREALRNAVINAAKQQTPEESVELILIGLVDQLTELHLRVLLFLNDQERYISEHEVKGPGGGAVINDKIDIYAWLQWPFPELNGKKDLAERVILDLNDLHLSNISSTFPYPSFRKASNYSSLTTAWGKQLIRFISSPDA